MTRRTRFTAGVLALLALAFSFAESVWASTCAPMPPMEVAAQVEGAPSGALEVTHGSDSNPEGQERPCPFGSPAAAQLCAGLAVMPAGKVSLPARASEGAAELPTLDVHSGLLLDTSLFRPPRA